MNRPRSPVPAALTVIYWFVNSVLDAHNAFVYVDLQCFLSHKYTNTVLNAKNKKYISFIN